MLEATASTSEDGGSITYTAKLVDAGGNAVTAKEAVNVTLENGESITIAQGASQGDSAAVAVDRDDVYEESDSITNSIKTVSGGESFEDLQADTDSVSTTITDDQDVTTVSLSVNPSNITEDVTSITYTATVDNAPKTDMTVTLSDNTEITIAAGQTSGSKDVAVTKDDLYKIVSEDFSKVEGWGDEASASRGGRMILTKDETAVKTFDFGSEHANQTVKIEFVMIAKGIWESSGAFQDYFNVNVNGKELYSDSFGNGRQNTVSKHYSFEVQTDENGQVILSMEADTTDRREYAAIDNLTMTGGDDWSPLLTTTIKETSGGEFEKVAIDLTPVKIYAPDTTTVSLDATSSLTEDGGVITYTATVDNAPKTDMTVTLDNGKTITIKANETTGTTTVTVDESTYEDVYKDSSKVDAKITATSGGGFENLDYTTKGSASTSITDTIDATTVAITTNDIKEGVTSVSFDIKLSNPPQGSATVQVEVEGTTYNVAVDENGAGTLTINNLDSKDEYKDLDSIEAEVTGVTGGNYESVTTGQSATSTVLGPPKVLLEESFENLTSKKGFNFISDKTVTGDHGNEWEVDNGKLEIQRDVAVAMATDGRNHAELDSYGNTVISTDITLNTSSNYTLTFDYQPRPKRGNKDTSDIKVDFDGKTVEIDSDSNGNLSFTRNSESVTVKTKDAGNGWTTVIVEYQGVDKDNATLAFKGTGEADTYGALLDNIKFVDQTGQYDSASEVAMKTDLFDGDEIKHRDFKGTITTGAGYDTVTVDKLYDDAEINTGEGNDTVDIVMAKDDSFINTGGGDDKVSIDKILDDVQINTGAGDDSVILDNPYNSFDGGSVNLGADDDTLTLGNNLRGVDASFDGGTGYDTIIIEDDISFDFDGLADNFNSFEAIDLRGGNDGTSIELDLSDVLAMTDDNGTDAQIMKILGDSKDEVKLDIRGNNPNWSKDGTTDDGFDVYTSNDDQAQIYIDQDIIVTDI